MSTLSQAQDVGKSVDASAVQEAGARLDTHVREIVKWHFSPESGTPFWLAWKKRQNWDPAVEVKGYEDLKRFPNFQDEWLRDEPNQNTQLIFRHTNLAHTRTRKYH